MSFQHYVTGSNDDNFALLASMYGVSASEIGRASGYTWSSDAIYGWLSSHGGTEQTPGVWSFTPGMVLNIPGNGPSQSPPRSGAIPGGPSVTVVVSPDGDTVVIPTDDGHDVGTPGGGVPADGGGGATQASAGGGLTNILLAGVAVGAVLYLFSGDKKKGKGRKTAKTRRKTGRRVTRRKSRR